ncbi:MAG TPA: hypothetical protein VNS80_04215 [Pseudolysinimonas sp.]|nr:hypothetical protein [Pseudolysinimonas sp.]
MTISMGPGSEPVEDEAPVVVAVGRTIGGILLVLIGLALALVGAFVYFIVPWIAPFTDASIWWTLSDLDFVFAIIGGIGLVLAVLGGSLIQRARKKRFEMLVNAPQFTGATDALMDDGNAEKRTGEHPPTIL